MHFILLLYYTNLDILLERISSSLERANVWSSKFGTTALKKIAHQIHIKHYSLKEMLFFYILEPVCFFPCVTEVCITEV